MAKKKCIECKKREERYSELNTRFYNELDEEIYTLPDEELKELLDEIQWQQQIAENEINELKDLIEKGEFKKRYIEAYIQLGRETIDTILYFDRIFDHSLSTLVAPKGYWHSGKGIIPIEEIIIDKKYKKNCKKWLNNFEEYIENNHYGLSEQLIEVASKYILPLIKEKKKEFKISSY